MITSLVSHRNQSENQLKFKSKMSKIAFAFSFSFMVLLQVVVAQRGSYAGVRPIANGIKGPFPMQATGLNNRFGDDDNSINGPQRLPVDALGDVNLVNKLSQRPLSHQPFWLLNYQQIEAHRDNPNLSLSNLHNRGSFMSQGLGRR